MLNIVSDIPTTYHNLKKYEKEYPDSPEGRQDAREAYFRDLAPIVLDDAPDLVVCAGFMLVITSSFLDKLAVSGIPILNLHPSLPGGQRSRFTKQICKYSDMKTEFLGKGAIKQAYDAFHRGQATRTGVRVSGPELPPLSPLFTTHTSRVVYSYEIIYTELPS